MDERLRVCRQAPRWGENGRNVPGVWNFPQDRLQDI